MVIPGDILWQGEKFRVIAEQTDDNYADYYWPENEILFSWQRRTWEPVAGNAGDLGIDALERAAKYWGYGQKETFARYCKAFHGLYVDLALGYSQGDAYMLVSDDPDSDAEKHPLVNWARGDVFHYVRQERIEWTSAHGDTRYEWQDTEWVEGPIYSSEIDQDALNRLIGEDS